MKIILETERLFLRQFTEADAVLVRQLSAAPGVLQYIPEPVPASDEEAKDVIINIILPQYKNGLGRWATHVKDTNEFIGWCGLKLVKEDIDLGYRFLPSAWGKGYATEAAKATLQYGHQNLKLEKVIAHAHIDNIASQKVLEKIGMQFVGEGIDDGGPVKGYVSFSNNL
ncbi:MAG: GNAT family N-acetyltransferase [Bacteroidota bacterium]